MPGLLSLPLETNADARTALGIAATQISRAYGELAAANNGDNSVFVNDLDIAQASTQGLYALVPNDAGPLAVTMIGKISTSLGNTQITLDSVAEVAAMPGATWDFGDALTGLVYDTVDTVAGAAKQVGKGAADALEPLLWEVGLAVAALVLLIVILKKSGASLGGLL